jgi:hypothetical protein
MLGKRIINATSGVACTTDTVQILDGVPFDSIATYELESDASNSVDTGYIGKSAVFNGSSSYISAANILDTSSAFTYSLWVNPNTISNLDYLIGHQQAGSPYAGVALLSGSSNRFYLALGGSTPAVMTPSLTLNSWSHIVLTHDGSGNYTCYTNNNGSPITYSGATSNNSSNPFRIGFSSVSGWNYFDGKIDEVRIYNTALTAGNVATLYAETASSAISISGLQAHYKFEGNATDETGNYDGTATNITYNEYDGTATNVTYTTGKFGNAAVFNGSSSAITINNTVSTALTFTASLWVRGVDMNRNSSDPSQIQTIFYNRNPYIVISQYGGNWQYTIKNSSSQNTTINYATSNFNNNEWYNIIISCDGLGGQMSYYVNGQSVGTNTAPTSTINVASTGFVGSGAGSQYFNGAIDQVRIYNKAISAANVATLYAETVATASTNISLNTPSGVAYYKMNDATDETGSYDGTATNVNFNVAGKFGNAASFNGSSSKITLPNSTEGIGEVDSSFSFWVYPVSVSSGYEIVALLTHNDWIEIRYNSSGQFVIYPARQSNSTYVSLTAVTKAANNWYNIVLTRDSATSTIKLYIDGSLVETNTSWDGTLTSSSDPNGLGANVAANTLHFAGKLDQVRIFDRAITANEVETLYNEVQCIPTIVPTDHFEPVIYTGDGQPTRNITGVGFQPDLVWIKGRTPNTLNHVLNDSVRGANKKLASDSTAAEVSPSIYGAVSSFTSDGFNLAKGLDNTYAGGLEVNGNLNSQTYVAWNWKAGGTAVSNTDGTITSQVSANVDAGFSIVSYTGTSTSGATIGHGLSQEPELIITKNLNDSEHWVVGNSSVGWTKGLYLSATIAAFTNNNIYGVDPTSTVYTVSGGGFDSTNTLVNTTNKNYIAYCFHSVEGYSRIGSYVGTGASNSIVTGFRPAYVMLKRTNSASDWYIADNKRTDGELRAAASDAERIENTPDFSENGFTLTTSRYNGTGEQWIYMAFAEENVQPEPELANSFNVVTYTGNGGTQAITGVGFEPDLVWFKDRGGVYSHSLYNSISGRDRFLRSNSTNSESTGASATQDLVSFDTNGFTLGTDYHTVNNANGRNYVAWCWKASNDSTINQEGSITSIVSANPAAGFSVVKFNGSTTGGAVGHGLDYAPELIIAKKTSASANWFVLHKTSGSWRVFEGLNTSNADADYSAYATVTDSVIDMVDTADWNTGTSNSYINYCFHSVAGYQKVGSYTGNGSSGGQTITGLGFNPRFLLVKNATSSAAWRITDSERGDNTYLYPNLSNADDSSSGYISLITDGFRMNGLDSNTSDTFIYLAIA